MNRTVNPTMLFLARECRGFSQSEFSEVVGLSQATISRYEGGLLDVSPQHLEIIAKALDYPVQFFFQTETLYGFGSSCESYHRKRQALPVRELRKIHAKINLLRMQIARMLRNAEIESENRFSRMEIDQYGSPERIAAMLRASWRMPLGPVRSMVGAIESAGGVVFYFPFETRKFDAVSQWQPGLPPIFFVNSLAPADRVRFTLAHEVGHIIMHETPSPDIEQEADRFAAEFLMPERDIKPDLSLMSLSRAAALKPYWKVSMASIVRRAHHLGQISTNSYKNACIQMGRLGYRLTEPNPLPPEKPTIVSRLLAVHFDDHKYNIEDMSSLLTLHEQEFRKDFLSPPDGLRIAN